MSNRCLRSVLHYVAVNVKAAVDGASTHAFEAQHSGGRIEKEGGTFVFVRH